MGEHYFMRKSRSRNCQLILAGVLLLTSGLQAGTNACDLNSDGVVNNTDVSLAVNMALGSATCTNLSNTQRNQ